MGNNYALADLNSLGGGEAVAKFNHELGKAFENCRDPNTDTKAKRKVTLEVTLEPDAKRQKVEVKFLAKSSLAHDSAGVDQVVMTKDKAYVDTARQLLIEDYGKDVADIGDKEGSNDQ
jgi:hypothetical protein